MNCYMSILAIILVLGNKCNMGNGLKPSLLCSRRNCSGNIFRTEFKGKVEFVTNSRATGKCFSEPVSTTQAHEYAHTVSPPLLSLTNFSLTALYAQRSQLNTRTLNI